MLDPDREEGEALARVCVEKLGGYLRDEGGDQNRMSQAVTELKSSSVHLVIGYGEDYSYASAYGCGVSGGNSAKLR